MPSSLKDILALFRPRQWTKNLVCMAGAFFAGSILNGHVAFRACLATAAFCAASSFAYVLNDILDRDRDRNHPRKKFRPIASRRISIPLAVVLAAGALCLAFLIAWYLGGAVLGLLCCYMALNLCYSAGLKNLSLVDTGIIAAGFILRIYVGTVAVGVTPSAWILLCTFFLALFLAFGKRRAEINAVSNSAASGAALEQGDAAPAKVIATRGVLHKYNITMLDRFCNICATLSITTYALFTVLGHANRSLIITTPPVVAGIFRYILLVERYNEGEAPDTILLKDWGVQIAIVIWAILYIAVVYFGFKTDVQ